MSVSIVVMVPIAADWIRYEHAACRGDGNSGDEQKNGCEEPKCAERHASHLLSHHLDLSKNGARGVQMTGFDLALSERWLRKAQNVSPV